MVVDGVTQGVRTFVVHLTNGTSMCPGITTALLPQRPGCRPLDHAVTSFNHVRLSRDNLLGEIDNTDDKRTSFFRQISRVSVGGLALSLVNVPALKAGAYLAYTFSQQRTVINPTSQLAVPVLSFPTQYGPIISAAAHATVMEAAGRRTIAIFQQRGVSESLRQALVGIFKATATYATQRHLSELTDRCGWRGLFSFNKISELQLALKGNSIAEGDVLVLCISNFGPARSKIVEGEGQMLILPRTCLRTVARQTPSPTTRKPSNAACKARTWDIRRSVTVSFNRWGRPLKPPLRRVCPARHSTCPRPGASDRTPLRIRQCLSVRFSPPGIDRCMGVRLHPRRCSVVRGTHRHVKPGAPRDTHLSCRKSEATFASHH